MAGRPPRKLAGILAEAGSAGDRVLHVVLGIGINVLPAAYPPEVAARATSLEGELGRAVPRGAVLAECLAALWRRYTMLGTRDEGPVLADWRGAPRRRSDAASSGTRRRARGPASRATWTRPARSSWPPRAGWCG